MKTKTETKAQHTPTPLSRAQKHLDRWRETLRERIEHKDTTLVGQVAVKIQGDRALESQLVEQARAAVKDWESIVRWQEHEAERAHYNANHHWTNCPKCHEAGGENAERDSLCRSGRYFLDTWEKAERAAAISTAQVEGR